MTNAIEYITAGENIKQTDIHADSCDECYIANIFSEEQWMQFVVNAKTYAKLYSAFITYKK